MNLKIKGIIVPLITPFDERGNIDTTAVKCVVDYLIERGIKGLFPCGTTGEGPLLSIAERKQMAEAVVAAVDGRIPVIVHTGAINTAAAMALTQHAQSVGAQAAALIAPYFFHHTAESLFQHLKIIASQVPEFPIYLYNNPAVGNNHNLSLELVTRLVEACPNIVGMKDSSGSLNMSTQLAYKFKDKFNTAIGCDGYILAGMAVGIDAYVSGNAHVVPELAVALHQTASEDNLTLARQLQQQLDDAIRVLEDGRDLSIFKGLLARRGLPVGTVRPPLLQAPEAVIEQRWQALNSMDLEMIPA
jgi:4-hydroxy-tetrahydrodipicolinate synthase